MRVFTMPDEPEQPEITHQTQQANMSNIDYSKTTETRFYANHVASNVTAFDIRMIMSDVDIDGTNNKLIANSTVAIIMSPQLAVFLYSTLGQAIQGYQAKFGSIPIPGLAETMQPQPLQVDPTAAVAQSVKPVARHIKPNTDNPHAAEVEAPPSGE
jgi:hypothetical protein